jgi:hypothetical protein
MVEVIDVGGEIGASAEVLDKVFPRVGGGEFARKVLD